MNSITHPSHKILIVEDDADIAKNLSLLLSGEGYGVTLADTQKSALDRLASDPFDLVLLDISLPDGNGYTLCTAAKRQRGAPVIFLTASDDEISVVTGLDLGADDYIIKPFRPMELLSRIKSVLRRNGKSESVFETAGLKIDSVHATVSKNGAPLFLSALEYRLLLVFANNHGIVLSREKLLSEIWDIAGEFVNDNTLTVYIKRLRDKIEEVPQSPTLIKTVRGLGYRFGA
ncbi:MAG: response regulator transcription factor [Peptococcaceae bacterium]|nr:response regulator transcription factor [Peptococcaceae bacterium]